MVFKSRRGSLGTGRGRYAEAAPGIRGWWMDAVIDDFAFPPHETHICFMPERLSPVRLLVCRIHNT